MLFGCLQNIIKQLLYFVIEGIHGTSLKMPLFKNIYTCLKHKSPIGKNMCSYLQMPLKDCDKCTNIEKYDVISPAQNKLQDLSTVTPYFPKTFNLAAYANTSETLQNLIKLKVNLSLIEKKPYIVEKILKLDFEQNMKRHIVFLTDYVDMELIGEFITKNPMILCENLTDLEARVNYLQSKDFASDQIKRIICKNPFWLMFSTTRIDRRLGFFQKSFDLCGTDVRHLATRQPNLITYNVHHVKTNLFVIKEEMGFNDVEIKKMVLNKPKLWMLNQRHLLERFNYIHNNMKIPHATILENLEILMCRNFRIKQRHLFLEKLGRAQYNPKKENYITVKALVENTDVDFCQKYAKCNVDDFNFFLKTL